MNTVERQQPDAMLALKEENERLRAALEEIRRIAHPYGQEKRMADKALAAIDAAREGE